MPHNLLSKSVKLVLGVLLVLLVLHIVPSFEIGGFTTKKIDLLSDVRLKNDSLDNKDLDSLSAIIPKSVLQKEHKIEKTNVYLDSTKIATTFIEDFSDETHRGMNHFFEALNATKNTNRKVYIAYFGDSFIEADILTSDLRHMLQQKYGGQGVGFVPITSNVATFRTSVTQKFSGWKSFSIMDRKVHINKSEEGLAGTYFIPQAGASLSLTGTKNKGNFTNNWQETGVILKADSPTSITMTFDHGEPSTREVQPDAALQNITYSGDVHSLQMKVNASSSVFYGITMDGKRGVALDNYSLRGNSGLNLASISDDVMTQMNRLRPYDLIILQYGLNVANAKQKKYTTYTNGMKKVIEKIKRNFPQASILLVSVSDRDQKNEEGELTTMPGVRFLVQYQRDLAAETHVAFWNLFEAMGGVNAIQNFVNHKPPLANKDYTHINYPGGKEIARIFFETLEFEKGKYDKQQQHP